MSILDKGVS